ncbi:MAG: hypothetical protein QW063_01925 [Candidatus Nanoarchaeia archaeon]
MGLENLLTSNAILEVTARTMVPYFGDKEMHKRISVLKKGVSEEERRKLILYELSFYILKYVGLVGTPASLSYLAYIMFVH